MTMTQIVPTSTANAIPLVPVGAMSMTSQEIAELVESRHDSVKRTIERLANQGVISLPPLVEVKVQRERREETVSVYQFTGEKGKRDSIIVVAQLSPEFTARLVDRWQELEAGIVAVPRTFAEALRLAADKAEQAERLAIERDVAVATKAEIGSRREATAMNTASQAIKQVNKLSVELDRSKQYATVKRMEMLYQGVKFNWRLLKSTSIQMDMPPIDVFDQNYGTVKAYHADVWRESYALEIEVS